MTEILKEKNIKDIEKASLFLKRGGLVIFPTDTVFGLGASVYNDEALDSLYHITGRPKDKPLAILIDNMSWVSKFAFEISESAFLLMDQFWPGPLTLVFKASAEVPKKLNINGKIGLRIPGDGTSLDLIKSLGFPIAAKSANFSGKNPPGSFEEIDKDLIVLVKAVIEGDILLKNPSTVVDVSEKKCKIIREGIVTKEAIEALVEI